MKFQTSSRHVSPILVHQKEKNNFCSFRQPARREPGLGCRAAPGLPPRGPEEPRGTAGSPEPPGPAPPEQAPAAAASSTPSAEAAEGGDDRRADSGDRT